MKQISGFITLSLYMCVDVCETRERFHVHQQHSTKIVGGDGGGKMLILMH